jgi:hypothetical protein
VKNPSHQGASGVPSYLPLLPEEGKSEARGGGRCEHAPRRRTRDSMQRVVARGRAKRGVVGEVSSDAMQRGGARGGCE